jgi:hypothetical protein
MIGGLIGGFIGGTFGVISQLPFIPGLILVAALYLVWRCFQGDCWFAKCRGLRGSPRNPNAREPCTPRNPNELEPCTPRNPDPCQSYKSEGLTPRKPVSATHAELRAKISGIVRKNLGMSLKDFVNS